MSGLEPGRIATHPFLQGMPVGLAATLAACGRDVAFPGRYRLFEEDARAQRFWLIDTGRVALDTTVPGHGRVIIEVLRRGDVLGLSWMLPPYRWRFGAVTVQPVRAFEFDAAAIRAAAAADPALAADLNRRFLSAVIRRLQATRDRLIDVGGHPGLVGGSAGTDPGD